MCGDGGGREVVMARGLFGAGVSGVRRGIGARVGHTARRAHDRHPVSSRPRVAPDDREVHAPDQRRREVSASRDVVEVALAKAIDAKVEERRPGWEGRAAALASELGVRRLAVSNVVAPSRKR